MSFDETVSDLSDNAFRVLSYLRHHLGKSGNTVYPSIEAMSEDLKRATRTCKRGVAELKSAGYLDVKRGKNGVWGYTVKRADGDPSMVTKMSPRDAIDGDKNVTETVTNLSLDGDTHGDTDSDTDSDKFVIPPNNPHIGEQTEQTEQTEQKHTQPSEESKPDSLGDACVQALADLVKPTPEIPADLKRSIEQLGLHSWLDMLVNHGISPTDWRVRETIQQLHGKTDLKSPFGLARKIFNDLPEIQPAKSPTGFGRRPSEPAHVPNMRPPEKPKSANEAVHTEFCNRIAMSPLGGEECAAALAAINAVPKTKPPGEYRGELEAIARKFEVTE
jgi:hypothetical protein